MSIDAEIDDLYADAFDAFGVDATVQRGFGTPQAVRVIVRFGIEQSGDMGQVVSTINTVDFMVQQWSPSQFDKLTWTDIRGVTRTLGIGNELSNNGHVAKVVLHGR